MPKRGGESVNVKIRIAVQCARMKCFLYEIHNFVKKIGAIKKLNK